MKTQLSRILSTMVGNTPAILRFRKEDMIHSKMVAITDHNLSTMICCLQEGEQLTTRNQSVSLIIKNELHYLHCTGKVCRLFLNGRVFTMELIKAALFIRKINNDTSWFEEIYNYDEKKDGPKFQA
jgi:hypothetical protein